MMLCMKDWVSVLWQVRFNRCTCPFMQNGTPMYLRYDSQGDLTWVILKIKKKTFDKFLIYITSLVSKFIIYAAKLKHVALLTQQTTCSCKRRRCSSSSSSKQKEKFEQEGERRPIGGIRASTVYYP